MAEPHGSDADSARMHLERIRVLVEMHREMRATALWQEGSRERSASMIVAANTILLSVVVSTGFALPSLLLCLLIYLLSRIGKTFVIKYYYLQERDYTRARALRNEIDRLLKDGEPTLADLFDDEARSLLREEIFASPLKSHLLKIERAGVHHDWFRAHTLFIIAASVSALAAVLLFVLGIDLKTGLANGLDFIEGLLTGANL